MCVQVCVKIKILITICIVRSVLVQMDHFTVTHIRTIAIIHNEPLVLAFVCVFVYACVCECVLVCIYVCMLVCGYVVSN